MAKAYLRRRCLMWGAVILVFFSLSSRTYAQIWTTEIPVTMNPFTHYFSPNNAWNIAASGDSVHIVCSDDRDGPDGIYYNFSYDNGFSWGPEDIYIGNGTAPSIAASGSNVHVVSMFDNSGYYDIMYYRSTDNGENWDAGVNISNTAGSNSDSKNPSIAVSGSALHVAWEEEGDILYAYSADNGANWDTTRIVTGTDLSVFPSIALSGSDIHVVWCDDRDAAQEIYCISYVDAAWGSETRVSVDNSNNSNYPSVAASDSNVYVVWEDARDGATKVYYNRSTDKGANWQASDLRLVDMTVAAEAKHPSIRASGGDVYVVWSDERNTGNTEIFFDHSSDNGVTWNEDKRLTEEDSPSYDPSLAVVNAEIHVSWIDERPNSHIFYIHGGQAQPDNHIKNKEDSTFIGDDIYNLDGTDQTKQQGIMTADTALYHVRIQNDGSVTDEIKVTGTAGTSGWTVNYYDDTTGGSDITSEITGEGWMTTELFPGDTSTVITAEVKLPTEPDTSFFDVLVSSTSAGDTSKHDVVKATTEWLGGFRPDAKIKGVDDVDFIGDNIYSDDGSGQTKTLMVDPSDTAFYILSLQNDAAAPDAFKVTGSNGEGEWYAYYYDAPTGGSDITLSVAGSGWETSFIDPDSSRIIRLEVVTPSSATDPFELNVTVTSIKDNSKIDVVKALTNNGGAVSETPSQAPLVYSLTSTHTPQGILIKYGLPRFEETILQLYDAKGALVRNLPLPPTPPGYYEFLWNGKDDAGLELPNGAYFCVFSAADKTLKSKVLLLK